MQGDIHAAVVCLNLLPVLVDIDDAGAVKADEVGACRMRKGSQYVALQIIKGQIRLAGGVHRIFLFDYGST